MNPEPPLTPPPPHHDPPQPDLSPDDESDDVPGLHAAILREKAEPKEGHEPISLWLVTFIGVLLFWGGLYLQRYSANYQPLIYDEKAFLSGSPAGSLAVSNAPLDPLKLGRRVYTQVCQACHQDTALGVPGQYPPLSKSEWVNTPGAARLIRIVLNGLSGPLQVNGQNYDNVMPAWRDLLSDAEIAAVLTYVRQEFGNQAPAVMPEQVATIREATKTRGSPGLWTAWTAADLKTIPETE
jgi:mono/diheme cytochrome c family protein